MTVLVQGGKILANEISKLSTKQLKTFLIIHAMAPYPALGFASRVLAAVREELESRERRLGKN